MNNITRIGVTTAIGTVADYEFSWDSPGVTSILEDYIIAKSKRCAICKEDQCKTHIVRYRIPYFYLFKNFIIPFQKYLDSRKLWASRDENNNLYITVAATNRIKHVVKGADVILTLNDTETRVPIELFRQYLIDSSDKEDRIVGNTYFTDCVYINHQRYRNKVKVRHFEVKILLDIVRAKENVLLEHIYKLSKTGELDADKQVTLQQLTTKHGLPRTALFSMFPENNGRTVTTPSNEGFGIVVLPRKFSELCTEDYYKHGMNVKFIITDDEKYVPYKGGLLTLGTRVARGLRDGDAVIVNRQPTLHWRSMMVHRVKFADQDTIGLHSTVTQSYNADFDGDEINIHSMMTIRSSIESSMLLNVRNAFMGSKRLYIGPVFHELTVLHLYGIDYFPKDFYYESDGLLIANGKVQKGRLSKATIGISPKSAFYHLAYYGQGFMASFIDRFINESKNIMQRDNLTYSDDFLDVMIESGGRGSAQNRDMLKNRIGNVDISTGRLVLDDSSCSFMLPGSSINTVNSCYKGGLTPEETVFMALPIREALVNAKTKISETGALMNRLSLLYSSLIVDANGNIVINGICVSKSMSLMYKYYNTTYDSYIDLRQLVYSVVIKRLENPSISLVENLERSGLVIPPAAKRLVLPNPKVTYTDSFEDSYSYVATANTNTLVVNTIEYESDTDLTSDEDYVSSENCDSDGSDIYAD